MTDQNNPYYEQDLEKTRDWFRRLNSQVNALDFAGARNWVSEDFIAFGTFADFIEGIDDAEKNQWRNVWPTIQNFHVRIEETRAIFSPDRLFAVGLAFFDSVGIHEDGSTFTRRGRATVTFTRKNTDEDWLCNHSHMSLMRGTPSASHGHRTA